MTRWRQAWQVPLPDVSRPEARLLVVSLAVFWGLGSLLAGPPRDVSGGITFVAAFGAGWFFYVKLYRVWGERLLASPSHVDWQRRTMVVLSLFRPAFIIRVLRSTGWPPVLVGATLLCLLALSLRPRELP